MRKLTAEEVLKHGIQTIHHEMDNGERRYRLCCASGSSYILTQAQAQSAWQNSHVHEKKKEYYIVESGWILIARYENGQLNLLRLNPDETCFIPNGVMHNIYMVPGSILHTVKYGTEETDWQAAPELDQLLEAADLTPYLQNQ